MNKINSWFNLENLALNIYMRREYDKRFAEILMDSMHTKMSKVSKKIKCQMSQKLLNGTK